MGKQVKIVVSLIVIAILIALGTFIVKNVNSNNKKEPNAELKQKANEIFGTDYCTTDHTLEIGGDAFTTWECKLCGELATNPNTNVPEICSKCAIKTKRCMECGKLKGEEEQF